MNAVDILKYGQQTVLQTLAEFPTAAVETAWLEAHLSDDDLCIVDARWLGDGTSRALSHRIIFMDVVS